MADTLRRGVRLGVDVGSVRVGVARSDRDGLLATPLETIARTATDVVARVAELAKEYEAFEVVVGLPVSLSGSSTRSTEDAREVAMQLAAMVPVRMVDERLSTVTASANMRASGRSSKKQRSAIDQAAAVVILQHALDSERATGRPPGNEVVFCSDAGVQQ